jgi:hypothetical protein
MDFKKGAQKIGTGIESDKFDAAVAGATSQTFLNANSGKMKIKRKNKKKKKRKKKFGLAPL